MIVPDVQRPVSTSLHQMLLQKGGKQEDARMSPRPHCGDNGLETTRSCSAGPDKSQRATSSMDQPTMRSGWGPTQSGGTSRRVHASTPYSMKQEHPHHGEHQSTLILCITSLDSVKSVCSHVMHDVNVQLIVSSEYQSSPVVVSTDLSTN